MPVSETPAAQQPGDRKTQYVAAVEDQPLNERQQELLDQLCAGATLDTIVESLTERDTAVTIAHLVTGVASGDAICAGNALLLHLRQYIYEVHKRDIGDLALPVGDDMEEHRRADNRERAASVRALA